MARARRERPEAEPEVDIDDDARDYVMARLAGARASAQAALDAIDEALVLFVNPDEDEDGEERSELVEGALEALGAASRGVEAAQEKIDEVDMEAGEPWEEN